MRRGYGNWPNNEENGDDENHQGGDSIAGRHEGI